MHVTRVRAAAARVLACLCIAGAASGCGDDGGGGDDGPGEGAGGGLPARGFPEDFLFGTAVAGFQAEMGCPTVPAAECEDPGSDWYAFITDPRTVGSPTAYLNGDPPSTGPGHYELYESDLDLARDELHNNAFRTGIEWSRLFPRATDEVADDALADAADPRAVAWYHRYFQAIRDRGLTPLVTLNHYTLPTWIHDGPGCHDDLDACERKGWLDRERTVREIARYAGFAAREFGGQVDLWATLNEPIVVLFFGYVQPRADRTNPPAVLLRTAEAKEVLQALIEGHARMYDAVKENDPDGAEVGVVYPLSPSQPIDPAAPLDVQAAANFHHLYNEVFIDAIVKGDLDADLDGAISEGERRPDLRGRLDYVGLNYYFRLRFGGLEAPALPALAELSPLATFNPLAVENLGDYPRGIYEMSLLAHERWGLPVIVTENGVPDARDEGLQERYLAEHLQWAERAMREGVDLRGYFYWTLMDNYEWNHGMDIRMGLYAVDKADPAKTRTQRKGVAAYGRIAQGRDVPDDLRAAFPIE